MEFKKEIYQEYDNYIVYNIYKIVGDKRKFLYRTTESKIKDKYRSRTSSTNKEDLILRKEI